MERFMLREATSEDMQLLFEWTNDPEVRAQSFCSDPISLDTHQRWFSEKLKCANAQIWILTDCGLPIGQIRCDCNDEEEGIISYSIARDCRRQGHGKRIVQMAYDQIRLRFPKVKRIVAFVKPENIASQRVFLSNGYTDESSRFVLPVSRRIAEETP